MRLILDLDHCLIFSSYSEIENLKCQGKMKYLFLYHRPGLSDFIKRIEKIRNLEIVFYTSAKSEYAKWVVNTIDPKIDYRLFTRSSTSKKFTEYGELYYKALSKLPLHQDIPTVVLDDRTDLWDPTGVNLIDIEPWHGEVLDQSLEEAFLKIYKLLMGSNRRGFLP